MSLASQITTLVRDVIKELARIADALEALKPAPSSDAHPRYNVNDDFPGD